MALIDKETIRLEHCKGCKYYNDGRCELFGSYTGDLAEPCDKGMPKADQPVIKKSNALFDKCVENCDPATMKEVSDNVDKMLGRQPVEGLEKEIDDYISRHFYGSQTQGFFASRTHEEPNHMDIARTARHFAEWGAEHLKR